MSVPSPNKFLVVIAGPTAVGKTAIAVQLAQHFSTEVISADSRQFYREMAIGTAKPTQEEQAGIPHHFVDFLPITEAFSAGKFEEAAIAKLAELHQQHHVVIMAGGSGLYIDAVCHGFDPLPAAPAEIREKLNTRYATEGIEALQKALQKSDPTYFAEVDQHNPHRLIRALEVIEATGKPFSEQRKRTRKQRPFNVIKIGLEMEREQLYDRINQRVDMMVKAGLVEEARSLYEHRALNALQTVGYRELFEAFNGKCPTEEAIAEIKKNTRRFAKRQLTWFRRDEEIVWFERDAFADIVAYLESELSQ